MVWPEPGGWALGKPPAASPSPLKLACVPSAQPHCSSARLRVFPVFASLFGAPNTGPVGKKHHSMRFIIIKCWLLVTKGLQYTCCWASWACTCSFSSDIFCRWLWASICLSSLSPNCLCSSSHSSSRASTLSNKDFCLACIDWMHRQLA